MHKKCLRYVDSRFPSQEGKRFLITGASSGIGLECAKVLCHLGAEVTFMVRNKTKAEECIRAIEAEIGAPVHVKIALYDQSEPSSIRSCVASLPRQNYDGIVLNAGVYFPKKGSLGEDGNPLTLQVNAIGTQVCFDAFYQRYPNAKYVIVDSIVNASPKRHDYAPLFHTGKDDRLKEYSYSKRICMAIFSNALQDGAKVYLAHPGITRTSIIRSFAPFIKRLANGIFYYFTHPAWKAALGMSALCCLDYEPGTYLVPRGLGEIAGYPKKRKIPKKIEKDAIAWRRFWEKESATR